MAEQRFSWARRRQAAFIFVAGALTLWACPRAIAITIIPTFDSSILNDPNGATIQATINSALQIYQQTITDPITVTLKFQEMGTGLGQNSTYILPMGYSAFRDALISHATTVADNTAISHIPNQATNPVNGNATVNVQLPAARALGVNVVPPAGQFDSVISLNTSIMNLSRTSINPNKYDMMPVAMHEINEALGNSSALSSVVNGGPTPVTAIWPMDLFRYDQNGARSFSSSASAQAYFSLDGVTHLAQFNQQAGGDFSDWYSYPSGAAVPHVQDAFMTRGVTPNMSVEWTMLDVLGYHLQGLPGDVNNDGIVNGQDIAQIASNWLATGSNAADANHDNIVNGQDIALVASNWLHTWGNSNGTGTADGLSVGHAVPEPATLVSACLAVFVLLTIGRRWK